LRRRREDAGLPLPQGEGRGVRSKTLIKIFHKKFAFIQKDVLYL
jgi:hypothetical protein